MISTDQDVSHEEKPAVELKELSKGPVHVYERVVKIDKTHTYHTYYGIMVNTNVRTHKLDPQLDELIKRMRSGVIELCQPESLGRLLVFNKSEARFNTNFVKYVKFEVDPEIAPTTSSFHFHALLYVHSYATLRKNHSQVTPHMIHMIQDVFTKHFNGLIKGAGRPSVYVERFNTVSDYLEYTRKQNLKVRAKKQKYVVPK